MKKFILYLLILIGLLGILDTILVIPISTGIGYGTLMPAGIGICLIVYSILKLIKKAQPIISNGVLRKIVSTVIIIGICVFLLTETLLVYNATKYKVNKEDNNYVIVLGCGVFSDGRLTLTLMNRLDAAKEYLDANPDALCIVSGGQGPNEPTSEAFAMKKYLLEKNLPAERIIMEDQSTSTKENLLYSMKLMEKHNPDLEKTAAIVTNDFHIFRSLILAEHVGIDASGIACPTPYYIRLNCYLREFLAIYKSLVFDMR
jgi:uncharacterized SAM-binding protein YcdF (DUF218 family)